jgi:hypothetical protein
VLDSHDIGQVHAEADDPHLRPRRRRI